MITVTDALLARLRCWVEQGKFFSALVDYRKHPELLPEGEIEGVPFSLRSPDELPVGTTIISLEIKISRANQIMYCYFAADQDLECDWYLAVLDSTLRLHYLGIGEVLELMRGYGKPESWVIAKTLEEEKTI